MSDSPLPQPNRRRRSYSRLDRVNEALREVIAEELERVDDERLELVTVTGIRVEADLGKAIVWISSLSAVGGTGGAGTASATPDEVLVALGEQRVRLQAAVARQLRLKRTPGLVFQFDPAIAVGTRVEEILRGLNDEGSGAEGTAHE